MSDITKKALLDALKEQLKIKPLEKITINDLTKTCGISRMAFYYHFKDIYDLIEWGCLRDTASALQGKRTYDTWQEGLLQIFEAVLENKTFIMQVYRGVCREQIENFLFSLTHDLIMNVVKEKSAGLPVSEENQAFIADFYKYGFVGIMLDWISKGMKEDYHDITEKMAVTLEGTIVTSIRNFCTAWET